MRAILRKALGNRFVWFAGIGLLCLVAIQLPIMQGLMEVGVNPLLANAVGFVLSAVVNFDVQRRFTFDNGVKGGWLAGMFTFQATSLGALGVNTLVFWAMLYEFPTAFPPVVAFMQPAGFGLIDAWPTLAAFCGAVIGTGVNFVASRFITFRRVATPAIEEETMALPILEARNDAGLQGEQEQVPDLDEVRAAVAGESLSVFMPAYKEADNLPTTVGDLVGYLRELNLFEFKVIIVNDGSPDDTGPVADKLAMAFPDEVEVIHHPKNQGYGGALITGFNAVVERGLRLWAFCDSDGQFDPKSFGTLLVALFDENGDKAADLAVGRRLGRRNSDSAWRFWLGRSWHFFGKFVVGRNAEGNFLLSVHDVDCGIKAGFTKSLARIVERLQGQAAAISPELIARTNLDRQVITERGVTHLSRLAGTSTGDDPRVMVRSAWNIIKLGMRFRKETLFGWVTDPANDAQLVLELEGWKK